MAFKLCSTGCTSSPSAQLPTGTCRLLLLSVRVVDGLCEPIREFPQADVALFGETPICEIGLKRYGLGIIGSGSFFDFIRRLNMRNKRMATTRTTAPATAPPMIGAVGVDLDLALSPGTVTPLPGNVPFCTRRETRFNGVDFPFPL